MPEGTAADKATLRRQLRERRRTMPPDERLARTAGLWMRTLAALRHERLLVRGTTLMAFHAFGDEPRTEALFSGLWGAGVDLVLPRVEGSRLVPAWHRPDDPLVPSGLGIPEPAGAGPEPDRIAAIIVPGLAFDRHGGRLGSGAGFYDRFLPALASTAIRIGVCLDPLLVDRLPVEAHDVPMHLVVTDRRTIDATT